MANEVARIDTAVSKKIFTPAQEELYEKLLAIVDRSLEIRWERGSLSHNNDFILLEGNIEPTRNYCLKAANVAGYNFKVSQPTHNEHDGHLLVSVRCKVWDSESEVMANGACSTQETQAGRKAKNTRGYHDAVAIAETRAFKRALELKAGIPFVNTMVAQLFGTFGVKRPEGEVPPQRTPRDVTGSGQVEDAEVVKPQAPKSCVEIIKRIKSVVTGEVKSGHMDAKTGRDWLNRVYASASDIEVLRRFESEIIQEVQDGGA